MCAEQQINHLSPNSAFVRYASKADLELTTTRVSASPSHKARQANPFFSDLLT